MFLNHFSPSYGLLAVSDKATKTVAWISVVAAILLFLAIAAICFKGKKRYDAKHIALAGLTLGLSFALSYVKFSPVTSGGSITLASMVPLLIYAYFYGVVDGLLAGLIFGLLNFISGPWILTPMTFVLDYLLAYGSIGLMGLARKFKKEGKSDVLPVLFGTLLVYAFRFAAHLCSGFIYFAENSIWVDFPDWALSSGFVYSFIYQCLYLPADCLISAIVLCVLAKTGVIEKLKKAVTK